MLFVNSLSTPVLTCDEMLHILHQLFVFLGKICLHYQLSVSISGMVSSKINRVDSPMGTLTMVITHMHKFIPIRMLTK